MNLFIHFHTLFKYILQNDVLQYKSIEHSLGLIVKCLH